MTDGSKQGGKGKGDTSSSDAPEQKQVAPETRYPREAHLANARQAYGESPALVAAGLAVIDGRGVQTKGYTKSEVKAAIQKAKTTEIKEG